MSSPRHESGRVARSSVVTLLRAEAFAALVGAATAYHALQGRWIWFAVFFFAPDLSFVGYLVNARVGAAVYNAAHTYVCPAVLLALGFAMRPSVVPLAGLIWVAHIAFDRTLGYGLKYASGFGDTHLGSAGKAALV